MGPQNQTKLFKMANQNLTLSGWLSCGGGEGAALATFTELCCFFSRFDLRGGMLLQI